MPAVAAVATPASKVLFQSMPFCNLNAFAAPCALKLPITPAAKPVVIVAVNPHPITLKYRTVN